MIDVVIIQLIYEGSWYSLVSLNQKDDKINIILTFSELDLKLIENFNSKIKLKKMKLVELKVY